MQGNTERVKTLLGRIASLKPEESIVSLVRGDLFASQGEFAKAKGEFLKAHERQASESSVLGLSQSRWLQGKHESAVGTLVEWLVTHPDATGIREELASYYVALGQLLMAISDHEILLEANLVNNLAWFYHQSDDSRALETAQGAYALDATHWGVLDTLGWILVTGGESRSALRYLRDAQARVSDNPEVAYHLAAALHRLGRSE